MNIKEISREELTKHVTERLESRGVELHEMGELVTELQKPYVPNVTIELAVENIKSVLSKREVQNAILTGIVLDEMAERGQIPDPYLQAMLVLDDSLYGIDEIVPLSIVNLYGSIGLTNFGYLDKAKPGVIGRLDHKQGDGKVHTFLDDLVGAIVAAACSRIAHNARDLENNQRKEFIN